MNKPSSLLSKVAVLSGLALGAFALSAFAYSPWKGPTANPPGNNSDKPVQQYGNTFQDDVTGTLTLGAMVFAPGGAKSITDNQVLMSSGGNGTVKWGTVSQTTTPGSCNTVQVSSNPGSQRDVEALPLTINGANICYGPRGCNIYIWDEGTIKASKVWTDYYGQYVNTFRQLAQDASYGKGMWLFTTNNNTGTNGDSTQTYVINDWKSQGFFLNDDYNYSGNYQTNGDGSNSPYINQTTGAWSETSPDVMTIVNTGGHFYEVSVCVP